jgi:hypothetical protein
VVIWRTDNFHDHSKIALAAVKVPHDDGKITMFATHVPLLFSSIAGTAGAAIWNKSPQPLCGPDMKKPAKGRVDTPIGCPWASSFDHLARIGRLVRVSARLLMLVEFYRKAMKKSIFSQSDRLVLNVV